MLRLFVAAYPPPETAALLVEALGDLDLPAHRVVPADCVHMTLQFIGDTLASRLAEVTESVQRSAAGLPALELRPRRLISLPERGLARLVAAETDLPPALREVQRRLVARLARDPRRGGDPLERSDADSAASSLCVRPAGFDPAGLTGRDRFRPHLTLCRFRTPARRPPIDHEIHVEPFAVREVVLMKSTLLPSGARHDRVAAVALA